MNSENETEIPQFSPWLSVWLKPSDTIQRIIFSNPHPHVFLLAVLGTMAEFTSKLIDMGTGTALIELRAFIVIALSGLVLGIPGLYFSGFFLRLGGIILGGRAPSAQLRAVLAWGRAP